MTTTKQFVNHYLNAILIEFAFSVRKRYFELICFDEYQEVASLLVRIYEQIAEKETVEGEVLDELELQTTLFLSKLTENEQIALYFLVLHEEKGDLHFCTGEGLLDEFEQIQNAKESGWHSKLVDELMHKVCEITVAADIQDVDEFTNDDIQNVIDEMSKNSEE